MIDPSSVRAVAFDIDGTLYRNRDMYRVSFPLFLMHRRLIVTFAAVRKEIRLIRPIKDLCALQAKMTAARLGWPLEHTAAAIDLHLYREWPSLLRKVRVIDGVKDLLETLRSREITTLAVSDFPIGEKIEILGLAGLFDHAFSSEETNYLKPNREPFERIVELTRADPKSIVYVGNSYDYDVEGANAVGLRTAHFASRRRDRSVADFTFSKYCDLKREILGFSR